MKVGETSGDKEGAGAGEMVGPPQISSLFVWKNKRNELHSLTSEGGVVILGFEKFLIVGYFLPILTSFPLTTKQTNDRAKSSQATRVNNFLAMITIEFTRFLSYFTPKVM